METRFAFGASLDLDLLGIEVDDETLIPGLAVASSRAKPLAGNSYSIVTILSGTNLFFLVVDEYEQCLSTSVVKAWLLT